MALLIISACLGFVAMLCTLALIGNLIRDSVIVVVQTEGLRMAGYGDWHAAAKTSEQRVRSIRLTGSAPDPPAPFRPGVRGSVDRWPGNGRRRENADSRLPIDPRRRRSLFRKCHDISTARTKISTCLETERNGTVLYS
jgi:hypothetical protein